MKKRTHTPYRYSMAMPGFILFSMFFLIPNLMAFYYSFTRWNFRTAEFIGFENYIDIFTTPSLNIAFQNTFTFALLTTLLKTGLGLGLALLLNRKLKLTKYFRTVVFVPVMMSTVAIGLIFNSILHPSRGILNATLKAVGLDVLAFKWLIDPSIAIYSVVGIETWKWTGFSMVIFLAGLQAIDHTYYEAARVDGASKWQQFKNVTMPLIMPSFNNAFIINLIGGMQVFELIYATTRGGPGTATRVLTTTIYDAFAGGRMGEASAATVLLIVIVSSIAITGNYFLRKKEVEM